MPVPQLIAQRIVLADRLSELLGVPVRVQGGGPIIIGDELMTMLAALAEAAVAHPAIDHQALIRETRESFR